MALPPQLLPYVVTAHGEEDELLGVLYGEEAEEDMSRRSEDGGVCTDADSQSEDGNGCQTLGASEQCEVYLRSRGQCPSHQVGSGGVGLFAGVALGPLR